MRILTVNCMTGDKTAIDASPEEIEQAEADAVTAAAIAEAESQITSNGLTLSDRALLALAGNRTFLAIASPTNAQTLAQVKALTRQNQALIRLTLGQLDDTD